MIMIALVLTAAMSPTQAEQAAIMEADRQWLLGYNRKDAAPFDRIWADDAVLVTTDGNVKDKAAERSDVTAANPPSVTGSWTVSEQLFQPLRSGGVVIGRFTQRGYYKDQPFTRDFRYTNIYDLTSAGPKLRASHWSPYPKAESVPARPQ